MAWIDTYWTQIDSQNSSYPFISDTGLALQADVSGIKTIWSISESQNFGLPMISNTGLASQADVSGIKSVWNFHNAVNFGFPFITTAEEIPPEITPTPVKQYDYIGIYDNKTRQGGFGNNGLAILRPSACTIRETLNGGWNLTLEHPIDDVGIWRCISEFKIIKVLDQLYTINRCETNYSGKQGKIIAYAEHITYKMNDGWILPKDENGNPIIFGSDLHVQAILSNLRDYRRGMRDLQGNEMYDFTGASDEGMTVSSDFPASLSQGATWNEMIFQVAEKSGGELYRDNFYYSIRARMENALDNAFDIRIGLNLKGIKRTVDLSEFCTNFYALDADNNVALILSYSDDAFNNLQAPNTIIRSKQYAPNVIDAQPARDFSEIMAPKIYYEIDLEDVSKNPDFQIASYRYKVGDTGRVYDERLGGNIPVKIIGTEKDGITGKTKKITIAGTTSFIYENREIPVPAFPTLPEQR